jgi:hypothetical protein
MRPYGVTRDMRGRHNSTQFNGAQATIRRSGNRQYTVDAGSLQLLTKATTYSQGTNRTVAELVNILNAFLNGNRAERLVQPCIQHYSSSTYHSLASGVDFPAVSSPNALQLCALLCYLGR